MDAQGNAGKRSGPASRPASDLARHLARQAVQYDLARNGRILLRYFDPRVLDLLWPALTDEQQATLLGTIDAWHFIDRTSALRTLTAIQNANRALPQKLTLNERQWAAVGRVGLVNQALVRLQVQRQMPPHQAVAQEADNALYRAQMYGLHDEIELIEFAYMAMTLHPRFDEHPLMRPVLDAVRDGENFIDAMQRLNTQHWQHIRATPRSERTTGTEKQ
jgi:hypothetical protein